MTASNSKRACQVRARTVLQVNVLTDNRVREQIQVMERVQGKPLKLVVVVVSA